MFLNTLSRRIFSRTYYCAVPVPRCYSEKVRMLPSGVSSYTSPYFPDASLQSVCRSCIRPMNQAHGPRHRYRYSAVWGYPEAPHPEMIIRTSSRRGLEYNTKCSHISSRPCLSKPQSSHIPYGVIQPRCAVSSAGKSAQHPLSTDEILHAMACVSSCHTSGIPPRETNKSK